AGGHLNARQAQVGIQHADLVLGPAQAEGFGFEDVLAGGALLMMAHLAQGRLAQVDVGHLLEMVSLDLSDHRGLLTERLLSLPLRRRARLLKWLEPVRAASASSVHRAGVPPPAGLHTGKA